MSEDEGEGEGKGKGGREVVDEYNPVQHPPLSVKVIFQVKI